MTIYDIAKLGEKISDVNAFLEKFPEVQLTKNINWNGYIKSDSDNLSQFIRPKGRAVFYPSEAEVLNYQGSGSASMLYEGRQNEDEKTYYRERNKLDLPLVELFVRNDRKYAVVYDPDSKYFGAIPVDRIDRIIMT